MTRTVEVERHVRARPETIFPFFTDPALAVQWQGTYAELDPRPGGRYVFHFGDGPRIVGEYIELDPPHRLVLAWGWERAEGSPLAEVPPRSTTLEVVLTPEPGGTLVCIRILGLGSDDAAKFTAWGAQTYIARLAVAAEGGAPAPDPVASGLESNRPA